VSPFPGGRVPEFGPPVAFQEWIAVTTAHGMTAGEQLGLWRLVNPDLAVPAVIMARCLAKGWHDAHGPGYHDDCWDATPEEDDEAPESQ
jgi:hypothetical protein